MQFFRSWLGKRCVAFLGALLLCCSSGALAQQTAVKAARMLDVVTGKLVQPAVIHIWRSDRGS